MAVCDDGFGGFTVGPSDPSNPCDPSNGGIGGGLLPDCATCGRMVPASMVPCTRGDCPKMPLGDTSGPGWPD